jgi:hypothetical protein
MRMRISPYRQFRTWTVLLLCSCFCQCLQTYVSPYKSPPTGYLVVDGYISGNGPTQYTLSRTISLSSDTAIPPVTGAILQVEGADNSTYPLIEQGNGNYSVDTLPLIAGVKYRLRINIPGGETYLSDYVPYKPTPPIDSISWVYTSSGVTIYANTHDPTNSTRYYQWTYDQTWEYHSSEASYFIYDPSSNTVIPRTSQQMVFYCWMNVPLTNIEIGTSAKLAQDVIYEYPLVYIPRGSQALSTEYSIIVRQYALSDSGYYFLSMMAANSQSLGSIFDAQPTQLTSNIHGLDNPTEQVIGFVQAGTMQQQRIFISNAQVPNWDYVVAGCPAPDTEIANDSAGLFSAYSNNGYIPLYMKINGAWLSNVYTCVDCTDQGGSNQKPSFWPN